MEKFGNISALKTRAFFYGLEPGEETSVSLEQGIELFLAVDAIGAADARGIRDVYCRLNGQPRVIAVRDTNIESTAPANERADARNPGHIPAPFSGVVSVAVSVGDQLNAGQTVATIEAMKMEAAITTPVGGKVVRIVLKQPSKVEAGDLLIEVDLK